MSPWILRPSLHPLGSGGTRGPGLRASRAEWLSACAIGIGHSTRLKSSGLWKPWVVSQRPRRFRRFQSRQSSHRRSLLRLCDPNPLPCALRSPCCTPQTVFALSVSSLTSERFSTRRPGWAGSCQTECPVGCWPGSGRPSQPESSLPSGSLRPSRWCWPQRWSAA